MAVTSCERDATPRAQAASGELVRVTPADRGLVELPMLAPHLTFTLLSEQRQAVLTSESSAPVVLTGECYPDLLPLLDGTRTRHELVAALGEHHDPIEVQTALVRMATAGHVVSGDFAMDRGLAAFWCALGASPRWVQQRFREMPVEIVGDDEQLESALQGLGVAVTRSGTGRGGSELTIFVTSDYLDDRHAETNRRHLAAGTPWTLVRPGGVLPLFGPVFRPAEDAPCWHCLAQRMSDLRYVESFLRSADRPVAAPACVATPFATVVSGLAAAELAKWIVFADTAALHAHAVSVDAASGETARHRVLRRSLCCVCGDTDRWHPARTPVPVKLRPCRKALRNSGGTRSVPPEETIARLEHLVSPVCGVVRDLARTGTSDDSWFFVYGARTAQPRPSRSSNQPKVSQSGTSQPEGSQPCMSRLTARGVGISAAGKGSTPAQARASCLCEALERYSGIRQGGEIFHRARFADLPDGQAIHPNRVELFSAAQLAHGGDAEDKARDGDAEDSRPGPMPFDPDAELDWTPVWSFTAGSHRYLPTGLLYFGSRTSEGAGGLSANSNGCASGNSLEEAILQGFFELVERDAFACWWYNRIRVPGFDLASFAHGYLAQAHERYASLGREVWILDVTHDLGVPVCVAISRAVDGEEERIVLGAGAHLDPQIAAMRALCELNQGMTREGTWKSRGHPPPLGKQLEWNRTVRVADHPYLAPDPDRPLRVQSDYPVAATSDHRDDVEACREIVEREGLEFLVLDQTRPDIGLPVARVVVPGLRHFWPRFAPGRLYDVPVEMGWLEVQLEECELNPLEPLV